jgi:hypothetical protein
MIKVIPNAFQSFASLHILNIIHVVAKPDLVERTFLARSLSKGTREWVAEITTWQAHDLHRIIHGIIHTQQAKVLNANLSNVARVYRHLCEYQ